MYSPHPIPESRQYGCPSCASDMAALRAENATLKEVNASQQKVIARQRDDLAAAEVFRQNVLKDRAYLRRGDIDPTTKVTTLLIGWELSISFGNDNRERSQQYKTISAERIAEQVGASKAVVADRIRAMTTPTDGFTPIFEAKKVWKKHQETGKPYSITQLAPPEGKNWLDTWGGDPAAMPVPPAPTRQVKNAEHQRAKAAEARAVVAEARRILAQCPACGSLEVSLRCHACGTLTTAAEALPAPTCQCAESARTPRDIPTTTPAPMETVMFAPDTAGDSADSARTDSSPEAQRNATFAAWEENREREHMEIGARIAAEKAAKGGGRCGPLQNTTRAQDSADSARTGERGEAQGDVSKTQDVAEIVLKTACIDNGISTNKDGSTRSADSAHAPAQGGDHADSARASYTSCVSAESACTPDAPAVAPVSPALEPEETPLVRTAHAVAPLVGGDWPTACVLAHATNALVDAVGSHPNHVVMQRRATEEGHKYLTRSAALTHLDVARHLVGSETLGAGLLTSDDEAGDPRTCRAVAYDSDHAFGALVRASRDLAKHGLTPLLVRNDAKRASGHLWLLFDRDVDPAAVFAVLETWAPALQKVPEKFPAPAVRGGHRLRLPGGCYLPVGSDPVPVQVGVGTSAGDVAWVDALCLEAWALIAAAVTPAGALEHAWLPVERRAPADVPPPPKKPAPPPQTAAPTGAGAGGIEEVVDAFNRQNPVVNLVDVNRSGMFRSPWHADASPSCKLYDNGSWCDFSRDNRGGDALSLWCALNGHWESTQDKPDRVGALRKLGLWPPPRQDSCQRERRGDDLLVRLLIGDRAKWERAKASFRQRFPSARFSSDDKAWVLPIAEREAVNGWMRAFAAAERGSAA